ncbi:MAG: DEAD/DEAH box helicase [Candidatus Aenigmarchaeota archaeon]|nr:DEAD/DEAH box helicase [Candidatus Aenigmarchaeota archaeon]
MEKKTTGFTPAEKFEGMGLDSSIIELLKKNSILSPTPVQKYVIPALLAGKDVQTQSETGSGKTLGFALPLIERTEKGRGLQVLVIAPTRELALQITEEFKRFSGSKKFNILTVYGGSSINVQISQVGRAEIVVGTPGRLLDLLRRGHMPLHEVRFLVLDEADRMLDMGFIEDIEQIIRNIPASRQTCLFSATLPDEILRLSHRYLKAPVQIKIKPSPVRLLDQFYYDIRRDEKFSLLVHLLSKEKANLNLVFCNTKRMADTIGKNLKKNGFRAAELHGDMSQAARERTVDAFKAGEVEVLVATDVAARGLHIDNVTHVYNYDIPQDPTTYTHRIGRTARAGASGKAISLLSAEDYRNFGAVMDLTKSAITKLEKEEFKPVRLEISSISRRGFRGPGRGGPRGHGGPKRGGPRRGFGRGPRRR